MTVEYEQTALPGVVVYKPRVHHDKRGFFLETYHAEKYRGSGLTREFVQDNYSHSCRGTTRGLHYQLPHAQGKLVSVIWGTIYDVAVDVRLGSPTFGQWVGQMLSDENRFQLFIPEGFAHGFCVLSDKADVMYKCTDYYAPEAESGFRWNDPDIGVRWPVHDPVISERDAGLPLLRDVPAERLPVFEAA